MENPTDDSIKRLSDWLSWFPTFGGIPPADIRDNSVSADDINPNGHWLPKALDYATKQWVKAVEPAETLEIGGDIMRSIHEGVCELRRQKCDPTVLYGNPQWAEDIKNSGSIVCLKDLPDDMPVKIDNMPPFRGTPLLDYSDGLYLFDNRYAQLYVAGAICALWNVRPLTVHLIRK